MSIDPNSPPGPPPAETPAPGPPSASEKKLVTGILAILLGGLGIHKFYLGYTKEGVIQLILGLACGIGAIIGIVEGIIYLTKTDAEFDALYVTGRKPWF